MFRVHVELSLDNFILDLILRPAVAADALVAEEVGRSATRRKARAARVEKVFMFVDTVLMSAGDVFVDHSRG